MYRDLREMDLTPDRIALVILFSNSRLAYSRMPVKREYLCPDIDKFFIKLNENKL